MERKKKGNNVEIFVFPFLGHKRINGTLGIYFAFEYLRVFICKSFGSLCCGYMYLGAAPVPYVQDAILYLPNFCLRSATVLLDSPEMKQELAMAVFVLIQWVHAYQALIVNAWSSFRESWGCSPMSTRYCWVYSWWKPRLVMVWFAHTMATDCCHNSCWASIM